MIVFVLALSALEGPGCTPLKGSEWGGAEDVVAVVCNGVRGFFVPTPKMLELRDTRTHEAYRLLEEELRLKKLELGEVRLAGEASERKARLEAEVGRGYYEAWKATDEAMQAAFKAAERTWGESPTLWFAVGFGVAVVVAVGLAWALGEVVPDSVDFAAQ